MIQRLFILFLAVLVFSLQGCARAPVLLDRTVVLNATDSQITAVKVLHEPTRKSGSVSAILPQKTLDIGFPGQPMLAERAVVSWQNKMGQRTTVELELPYDQGAAKEGRHMQLIYVVHPAGTVTAHLEPSELNTARENSLEKH